MSAALMRSQGREGEAPHARSSADPGLGHRLRGLGRRHPEWWVLAAAAAAWGFMAWMPHPHASHAAHGPGGIARPDVLSSIVMVVAMMLPLTTTHVRHVAFSSPRSRRHRAIATFLFGYLAVWIVAQLVIVAAVTGIVTRIGWTLAAAVAMLGAALWELAPGKGRQLRRCHRTVPLAPQGRRAERDCASYGGSTGIRCVATCWALMAACAAFVHSLPVMAVLFGVQVSGRYAERRSPVMAAAAVAGVCLLAIAARLLRHHTA